MWNPVMPLILLALMLTGISECQAQQHTQPSIRITKKKIWLHNRHFRGVFWAITFRLVNNTKKPLYVFGIKAPIPMDFEPGGYILTYNTATKQWEYPSVDNEPYTWENEPDSHKSMLRLGPRETLRFSAAVAVQRKQVRLRRVIYFAVGPSEIPYKFTSPEVLLTMGRKKMKGIKKERTRTR